MDLVEIDPNVAWYAGRSESDRDIYEAEEGELKVIFAGGLWFRRLIGSKVGSIFLFGSVNAKDLTRKDTYARDKFSYARRGD